MVAIVIVGFLIGAVFGLRFKVASLLILNVVGYIVIGATVPVLGQSASFFFYSIAAYTVAAQAGYLTGSFVRFTIAAARTAKPATDPSPARSIQQ